MTSAVVLLWGQHAVPSDAAAVLLPQLWSVLDTVYYACNFIHKYGVQEVVSTLNCYQVALAKQLVQSGLLQLLPQVLAQGAQQLEAACSIAATAGDHHHHDGLLGHDEPDKLQDLTDNFAMIYSCAELLTLLWPGDLGASAAVADLWQSIVHWVAAAVQYMWLHCATHPNLCEAANDVKQSQNYRSFVQ